MLGICKGHQFLNVLMGGSLYQDLSLRKEESLQHMQKRKRSYLTQHVEVLEGTRLASALGAGSLKTNSMHHQSVKTLGHGLKASGHEPAVFLFWRALHPDEGRPGAVGNQPCHE